MHRRSFLNRVVHKGAVAVVLPFASSCGTIIHPERVGQPAGRLDPSIVILNGLGLLLFLVPGVIAFIVDFSTGAIYLPPDYVGVDQSRTPNREGFVELSVDPDRLTREAVESAVSNAHGSPVRLQPGSYHATPVESLRDYPDASTRLAALSRPAPTEVVFRCQSE